MPREKKTAASGRRSKARASASANGNSKSKPGKHGGEAKAESAAVTLPENLDSAAAVAVMDMIKCERGNDLVVDAGQVRRAGAQSLQVLVSAARTWQADGKSYRVTNSSSELLDTIALIGLSREDLLLEGMMQ